MYNRKWGSVPACKVIALIGLYVRLKGQSIKSPPDGYTLPLCSMPSDTPIPSGQSNISNPFCIVP